MRLSIIYKTDTLTHALLKIFFLSFDIYLSVKSVKSKTKQLMIC